MKNINFKKLEVPRKKKEPQQDWEKQDLTENHTKAVIFHWKKKVNQSKVLWQCPDF